MLQGDGLVEDSTNSQHSNNISLLDSDLAMSEIPSQQSYEGEVTAAGNGMGSSVVFEGTLADDLTYLLSLPPAQ
jgi:hypothetical protein